MKTLNQIIEERKKLVRTGYPDSMTDFDYIVCFKKWLQQQQKKLWDKFDGEQISSLYDGLLEDLNK